MKSRRGLGSSHAVPCRQNSVNFSITVYSHSLSWLVSRKPQTISCCSSLSCCTLRTEAKEENSAAKAEVKDDPDSSSDENGDERTVAEDADIRDVRYRLEKLGCFSVYIESVHENLYIFLVFDLVKLKNL